MKTLFKEFENCQADLFCNKVHVFELLILGNMV